MLNLRRNPRGRPHSLQRLCWRVRKEGFFASLTRFAVVAIYLLNSYALNGMPMCFNRARAWSSVRAVVTIVTFMPFSLSTFE